MESIRILAIIVTYNGIRWIQKCLESINNSSITVDIVVIDNGSTDGTIEVIESSFSDVRLIKSNVNLYFGRGNNVGLKMALTEGYDYAFLLNQDAFIESNTIEHLVKVQQENIGFGILSPFHYNWNGDKVDHFFLQMINPFDCPNFLSDSFLSKLNDVYSIKFIHAACWIISRNCLEEVGGFDPIFYHYGEDNDYVERAKYKGYKIGVCPTAYVYHYGSFDVSKKHKQSIKLYKVHAVLELKTIQNTLIGNYAFFIKKKIDEFTTFLLARNFRNALIVIKIALFALSTYFKVKKSRLESKSKRAFLGK